MKIRYNEDAEVVARLREALLKKGLYCPCRLQKIEDNVCMCRTDRLRRCIARHAKATRC